MIILSVKATLRFGKSHAVLCRPSSRKTSMSTGKSLWKAKNRLVGVPQANSSLSQSTSIPKVLKKNCQQPDDCKRKILTGFPIVTIQYNTSAIKCQEESYIIVVMGLNGKFATRLDYSSRDT